MIRLAWAMPLAAALILAAWPVAADPVALIEDAPGVTGLAAMDYVDAGRVVELGADDTLVVDYLGSCMRETITGGIVTIGDGRSAVKGGKLRRETVRCNGKKLNLSASEASESGVVVFRGPAVPPGTRRDVYTIYGRSPIIDLGGPGRLVLERLDRAGEGFAVEVAADQLVKGRFYDMATMNQMLAAGATYRASWNGRSVTFKVDAAARPGATPLAGRLLRL